MKLNEILKEGDKILLTTIISNLSQSYINLGNFIDGLSYANKALILDKDHKKSSFRKLTCLEYL